MKFSQVVVLFSVLFALSYSLPYKMDMVVEDSADELAISNDPEKRFFPGLTVIAAKAAFFTLGKAVGAYCNQDGLSNNVQRGCKCSMVVLDGLAGDEEMKPEKNSLAEKRFLFSVKDLITKLKSAVNHACTNKYVKAVDLLEDLCECIQGTIV